MEKKEPEIDLPKNKEYNKYQPPVNVLKKESVEEPYDYYREKTRQWSKEDVERNLSLATTSSNWSRAVRDQAIELGIEVPPLILRD